MLEVEDVKHADEVNLDDYIDLAIGAKVLHHSGNADNDLMSKHIIKCGETVIFVQEVKDEAQR